MIIEPKIFKAYDIRGLYPAEVNEEAAEIIGRAFIRFLRKSQEGQLNIVVGRDGRLSSPSLCQALKKGILTEGANIIDIGLTPSPMFYFAVWKHGFDGGAMTTASHNPPQYNGLKIVSQDANMVGKNTGLEEVKEIALQLTEQEEVPKKGVVQEKDVLNEYIDFNFRGINVEEIKPLKIVIDTGNAVGGIWIEELKKRLPGEFFHLFPEIDGNFPNHDPDPLEEESIEALKNAVQEKRADLGMAFDGDGDRVAFVDEKGKRIPPDFMTALLSKIILRENPGSKIIYSICSSNIIRDVIKENKGVPIMWKIGHTFIKEKMAQENVIFGGEYSGHYCFKSHHFCEAPLVVLLKVLEELSQKEQPISQLVAPSKKYFYSGLINLEVKDKKSALELLEQKYKQGSVSYLDGIRIEFDNWWFNARASNTEDLLRVVVEARTKELMQEKVKEITNIIKKVLP